MKRRDLLKWLSVTTTAQYLDLCHPWFIDCLKNPKPTFPVKFKNYKFNAGELTLIRGRPSSGKTSLAIDIAADVAFGKDLPVSFFSIECSDRNLSHRFISKMTGISLDKVKHGRLSEIEKKSATFAASLLRESKVVIDDTPGIKPQSILDQMKKNKKKPPVVVVDYLQLMDSNKRELSKVETIQSLLYDLKQIAVQQKTSLIVTMQRGRYETDDFEFANVDRVINIKESRNEET